MIFLTVNDHEFISRVKSLSSPAIDEANLSKLAGWQQRAGEHIIMLRQYEDIVTPDMPGVRSPKNDQLCAAIARKLIDGAPCYLGWGERSYIARMLLCDGPSSFFSCFDAGDIDDHRGNPLTSMIVRPAPLVNSADIENQFYSLSGVSLERLPENSDRMLDLETLMITYDLSKKFRNYCSDTRPEAYDYSLDVGMKKRSELELERAARYTVNGLAAFALMDGHREVARDYMLLQNAEAILSVLEGNIMSKTRSMTLPYVLALPLEAPKPARVIDDYTVLGKALWDESYKGGRTRMQLYAMATQSAASVVKRDDLSLSVRQLAAGLIVASQRFNPALASEALGENYQLPPIEGTGFLLAEPVRPVMKMQISGNDKPSV